MALIVTVCALFVASQFEVISTFPNQRFGKVCWQNMRIILHVLSLFVVVPFYVSLYWL